MVDVKASGEHLAISAAFRVLASHVAQLANPEHPDQWLEAVGEQIFDYVERASNPNNSEPLQKAIKEAAYDALGRIFDSKRLNADG